MKVNFLELPRLFVTTPESDPTVLRDSWLDYAESYKACADALVNTQKNLDRSLLTRPVLFLYRHYVELQLKAICVLGFLCLEDKTLEGSDVKSEGLRTFLRALFNNHDLTKLIDQSIEIANRLGLTDWNPGENPAHAVGLIKELGAVDPRSYAFRYPIHKDLNPNLGAVNKNIDLDQFQKGMRMIENFTVRLRRSFQIRLDSSVGLEGSLVQFEDHLDQLCFELQFPGNEYERIEQFTGDEDEWMR